MDDNTFSKCMVSIRERVKFLRLFYGSRLSTKRTGMVSAGRLVHVLAARHLHEIRCGMEDEDSLSWYLPYLESAYRLCVTIQDAVKAGKLTLRHQPSHVPIRPHEIQAWLETDILSAAQAVKLFPDCAEWSPIDGTWPDGCFYPPGGIALEGAEEWAVSAGIATAAKLRELLGMQAAHPSQEAEVGQSAPAPAPAPAAEQAPPPEPVQDAPAMQPRALKRAALIAELLGEWPSIKNDLCDASRNGLDVAKLAQRHGMWNPDVAMEWAKSRGKLVQQRTGMSPATWCGPITRHQSK